MTNDGNIDTLLKCFSIDGELKKHRREYKKAVDHNTDGYLDDYIEQKEIILGRLEMLRAECYDAEI